MWNETDSKWLERARQLAQNAWGATHPNPLVGAVIARGSTILAEGWHTRPGAPHAEIEALNRWRMLPASKSTQPEVLSETTLYVTLEPCSTHGRTPPCVEAIINSGIPRIVVGVNDPNPAHAGKGLDILRHAGRAVVECPVAALREQIEEINLIFNFWIQRQMPFLAGKAATTIDGRIATRNGHSKWITGPQARADVMRWRRYFPAIMVGCGTVLADNPRLTSRAEAPATEWCGQRFIVDEHLDTVPLPSTESKSASGGGKREIPATAQQGDALNVYSDSWRDQTIVVTTHEAPEVCRHWLEERGIATWLIDRCARQGGIDWTQFLERCRDRQLYGIYCEGGGRLLSSLLVADKLNYLFNYRAPVILGDDQARTLFTGKEILDMSQATRLYNVRHEIFGDDHLMRGYLPSRDDPKTNG